MCGCGCGCGWGRPGRREGVRCSACVRGRGGVAVVEVGMGGWGAGPLGHGSLGRPRCVCVMGGGWGTCSLSARPGQPAAAPRGPFPLLTHPAPSPHTACPPLPAPPTPYGPGPHCALPDPALPCPAAPALPFLCAAHCDRPGHLQGHGGWPDGLCWAGLNCAGLCWAVLGYAGLCWVGLGWAGFGQSRGQMRCCHADRG